MKTIQFLLTIALLFPASALADSGTDWVNALRKNKARVAAKVTVPANLKYGFEGKDQVIAEKIDKHYKGLFRKLRKAFKKAELEKLDCTGAGRELGYMSAEWKSKNEDTAVWIRRIPEQFCETNSEHPPRVWMLKLLEGGEGDLPHAIVLFATGEDDLISGFYHF